MTPSKFLITSAALSGVAALVACGSGASSPNGSSATQTAAVPHVAVSSGTVTAFGSVFVNGHEFATTQASVFDDDAPSTPLSVASALAVGMSVDVVPASTSTDAAPQAAEIHVTPLVRGPVDAQDPLASRLSVMGQLVQLNASTVFRDARGCAQGSPSACTPIAKQADLVTRCVLGTSAYTCGSNTASSTVQVFGFTDPSTGTISASLVRVIDNSAPALFRATGALALASGGAAAPLNYSIGQLTIGSGTTCGNNVDCSLSAAQLVTARGSNAPQLANGPFSTLPIPVSFVPSVLQASRANGLVVNSTVELEGVALLNGLSSMLVQGVQVNLPSTIPMPLAGDLVEVRGTVTSTTPPTVTATALSIEDHHDRHAGGGFLIEAVLPANAASGSSSQASYTLSLLGTQVQVNAATELEDETAAAGAAFNMNTFLSYLSTSGGGTTVGHPRVIVRGYIDNSGSSPVLVARNLRLVATTSSSPAARIEGLATTVTPGTSFVVDGLTFNFTGTAATPSGNSIAIAQNDYLSVIYSGIGLSGTTGSLGVATVTDYGSSFMERGGD